MDNKAAATQAVAVTELEGEATSTDNAALQLSVAGGILTLEPIPIGDVAASTGIAMAENTDDQRCCWICFGTDEDNPLGAWLQPCQCRGTTKWVHQHCLYRWIDEKQEGNARRAVSCPQCKTEYIIVFPQLGKFCSALESIDAMVKRLSPFLFGGFFAGALYWAAVSYGAVTFMQIVGFSNGMALMGACNPLILVIGLPVIPIALVLGRLIRWEDGILRLIRNRHSILRNLPLVNLIYPSLANAVDDSQTTAGNNPVAPVTVTRSFCGALLLPTISSICGSILFESVENTMHRTLLGGLTFITVKGIIKMYLKFKQFARRKKRRIMDYNEEYLQAFMQSAQDAASEGVPVLNEGSGF